jgi:hypothetical protein
MLTPKAVETIASNQRLTLDEAKSLVALAKARGWISQRPDAHIVQFSKQSKPRRLGRAVGRFDPLP